MQRAKGKILLSSFGTPGYLFPSIRIAEKLRSLGHEVLLLTQSSKKHFLEEAGLTPFDHKLSESAFSVSSWIKPQAVRAQLEVVRGAVEEFKPDLIFTSELCVGPRLLAFKQGLPLSIVGLISWLWPGETPLESKEEAARWERLQFFEDLLNEVGESYLDEGAVRLHPKHRLLIGDRYFLRGTQDFLASDELLPEVVSFVGALESHGDSSVEIGSGHAKVQKRIYVQHDQRWAKDHLTDGKLCLSVPDFWSSLEQAFAGSEFSVCISTTDKELLARENLPANFTFVDIDARAETLQKSELVIGNATTSLVLEALLARAPMLLVNQGSESSILGPICEGLGVASFHCPETLSVFFLQAEVANLLECSEKQQKIQELALKLQSFDGLGVIAASVEEMLVEQWAMPGTEVPEQRLGSLVPDF